MCKCMSGLYLSLATINNLRWQQTNEVTFIYILRYKGLYKVLYLTGKFIIFVDGFQLITHYPMRNSWLFIIYAIFLLFLSLASFGQVGPMGIGNKDGTPTSAGPQPKLLLWLDGSSAHGIDPDTGEPIYGSNTPVDIWRDKSGNGFDFYPSVSGN